MLTSTQISPFAQAAQETFRTNRVAWTIEAFKHQLDKWEALEINAQTEPANVARAKYRILTVMHQQGKSLDLSNLRLKTLPSCLRTLNQLETVQLSGNCLTEIPEGIQHLDNISKLDLSHNEIEHPPKNLSCRFALKQLNLEHNQLRTLPTFFADISANCYVSLDGNPLQNLPTALETCSNPYLYQTAINTNTPLKQSLQTDQQWLSSDEINSYIDEIAHHLLIAQSEPSTTHSEHSHQLSYASDGPSSDSFTHSIIHSQDEHLLTYSNIFISHYQRLLADLQRKDLELATLRTELAQQNFMTNLAIFQLNHYVASLRK